MYSALEAMQKGIASVKTECADCANSKNRVSSREPNGAAHRVGDLRTCGRPIELLRISLLVG
jgi:hypothetical protein